MKHSLFKACIPHHNGWTHRQNVIRCYDPTQHPKDTGYPDLPYKVDLEILVYMYLIFILFTYNLTVSFDIEYTHTNDICMAGS